MFIFLYLAQTRDKQVQSSGWVMYQHCQDYCIRDPHFMCEEIDHESQPCPFFCVCLSFLVISQFRENAAEDEYDDIFFLCDISPGILTHYPEPWKGELMTSLLEDGKNSCH